MSMLTPKRCAVYCRVSSDERLDQSFNSIDAQRESGLSHVLSQRNEGWVPVQDTYEDPGYSGGNMERPGLKRLLADIKAGKVDMVVVYKIDRLSRSLADFAKMVEIFDKHQVSFSSVTQQINSATSTGRLMLNMLLSFAQFEREVSLQKLGLQHGQQDLQKLMDQYAQLDAFPECKSVLQKLSAMELPTAILSNGSPQMLQSAADHSGLTPYLNHLISVEQIRQFKTHPKAYALASKTLNIPTDQLLFVSSNGWDVMGATWYGFNTCWINRAGLPFETLGPRPSFDGSDLNLVLHVMQGKRSLDR